MSYSRYIPLVFAILAVCFVSCGDDMSIEQEAQLRSGDFEGNMYEYFYISCSTGEEVSVSVTLDYKSPGENRRQGIHDNFIVPSVQESLEKIFGRYSADEINEETTSTFERLTLPEVFEKLAEKNIAIENYSLDYMSVEDYYY